MDHTWDGRSERYMAQRPCETVEDAAADSNFHTGFGNHRWFVLGNKSFELMTEEHRECISVHMSSGTRLGRDKI